MSIEQQPTNPAAPAESTPAQPATPPAAPATAAPAAPAVDVEEEIARRVKTEKEKLYNDLSKEKERAAKIEKELAEFKKKADEEKARLEKERLEKLTVEQRLQEELAQATNKINQFADGFEMFKRETAEEIRKRDLALFKEKLVAGRNDYLPELVTGNSEEELKASFEASQRRYKEIISQVTPPAPQKPNPAQVSEIAAPAVPQTTPAPTATKSSAEIMNMTPEEYRAYKESVFQKYNL